MVNFLTIMGTVLGVVLYISCAVKIGFIVADKTEGTGFDAGFYMLTVFGLIAMPIAALVSFSS
ncbi:hypothetical protein SAMN05660666_02531 [Novosphingobium aromaticivorans]|uniref:hypothetical protein n=1 Tax=Novosphingobium aromaticivorans TaxID=48935 RepID=UPI0000389B47|nr:hypothetical protein [Novosphingobium aromaticivorans]SCY69745.1 hypothetical protein SAMN05660666_02531 [Novosphingobium aromaticivorans]